MEKFKKAFRFQLKFLPILGLVLIIIGSIRYETNRRSYQKVETLEEFSQIVLDNNITNFTEFRYKREYKFGMEIPSGERYYYHFKNYEERDKFEQDILKHSFSASYPQVFYEQGIPTIITAVIVILLFNIIVILWFVVLYDLLKSEFKENHNKWIWFIAMIILFFIAPLYYMLISEKQKRF